MPDEPRRKTRYRGERCSSKLTLNRIMLDQSWRLVALSRIGFKHTCKPVHHVQYKLRILARRRMIHAHGPSFWTSYLG